MKFHSKRFFNISGSLITTFALIFIIKKFSEYGDQLDPGQFAPRDWVLGLVMVFTYAALNFVLTGAWHYILRYLSEPIAFRNSIKVYGNSLIAKYVPGNVFQFLGRQALGMAEGISGRSLLKSTVWEIGLLCILGSIFSICLIPLVSHGITEFISVLLFFASLTTVTFIVYKRFGVEISRAVVLYIVFLILSGIIFVGLVVLISGEGVGAFYSVVMGCFIISWLAGLVTPGAPAGIGIRETVLLLLLSGWFSEPDVLMAVLAGRMITVSGDFLYFLVVFLYFTIRPIQNNPMP